MAWWTEILREGPQVVNIEPISRRGVIYTHKHLRTGTLYTEASAARAQGYDHWRREIARYAQLFAEENLKFGEVRERMSRSRHNFYQDMEKFEKEQGRRMDAYERSEWWTKNFWSP